MRKERATREELRVLAEAYLLIVQELAILSSEVTWVKCRSARAGGRSLPRAGMEESDELAILHWDRQLVVDLNQSS